AAGVEVEILSAADGAATTAVNLTGNEFVNILYGNAGNNVLNGGGGADYMAGGAGNDVYIVDNSGDVVAEAAGAGSDQLFRAVRPMLAAGVEVEILSAADGAATTAINLTGNEFVNILYGNAGNNVLNGGGGADYMAGGA